MNAAVTPARRLLALLDTEDALETRPRDEILADLGAHGIDPAVPIRLAQRLAEQRTGPAAALLGAVIEDEETDAEIATLGSADIGEVRGRLQSGTVAATTAEAQRRAGAKSNVVGIAGHRRRAVWAWTGSLVGLAACVLIVVTAWWPQIRHLPSAFEPAAMSESTLLAPTERAQPSADVAASRSADSAAAVVLVVPREEPEDTVPVADSERTDARTASPAPPVELADRTGEEDRLPPVAAAPPEAMASSVMPEPTAVGEVAAMPSPDAGAPEARIEREPAAAGAGQAPPLARSRTGEAVEGLVPFPGSAVPPELAQADPTEDGRWIATYLVVDPQVAPRIRLIFEDGYRELSDEGDLPGRLAEARQVAAGRHIVALAGLEGPDGPYDLAIVTRDPASNATAGEPLDPILALLYGDRAGQFEQIRLSPR